MGNLNIKCNHCGTPWVVEGRIEPGCNCEAHKCDDCQGRFEEEVPIRDTVFYYDSDSLPSTLPERVCDECFNDAKGHPHRWLIFDLLDDEGGVLPADVKDDVLRHLANCDRCMGILLSCLEAES
jgi:hypothetical protein